MEIGMVKEPPAKRMCITLSSIPQWSKRSLKQHVKKIEENLNLIQQGKEEDAEVFIGNNTRQRNGLNMVSDMLEGHLQKLANITLERTLSQATELLGTKLVKTGEALDKGKAEKEHAANQMGTNQGK